MPELEAAWVKAYALMADAMQRGAQEAATREPAWWRGELVAHERRSDDLAVLLVRTDRPYDYEPGQYASIETPYRPRSWRTYSMATAPSAGRAAGVPRPRARTRLGERPAGLARAGRRRPAARRPDGRDADRPGLPARPAAAWPAAPAWPRSRR